MGQRNTQPKAGQVTTGQAAEAVGLEETLQSLLTGLRYGSVEITVHNARIVQIERCERFRPEEEGFTLTPT